MVAPDVLDEMAANHQVPARPGSEVFDELLDVALGQQERDEAATRIGRIAEQHGAPLERHPL